MQDSAIKCGGVAGGGGGQCNRRTAPATVWQPLAHRLKIVRGRGVSADGEAEAELPPAHPAGRLLLSTRDNTFDATGWTAAGRTIAPLQPIGALRKRAAAASSRHPSVLPSRRNSPTEDVANPTRVVVCTVKLRRPRSHLGQA